VCSAVIHGIADRVLNIPEHRYRKAAYKGFKDPAQSASAKSLKEQTLQHPGSILILQRSTQQHASVLCAQAPPLFLFLTKGRDLVS
jgi:hypothetical protein